MSLFDMVKNKEVYGTEVVEENKSNDLNERLKNLIHASDLMVFIKGTPDHPMCGFSAKTLSTLNNLKVPFKTFNILEDGEVRQGLKEYSNWPTYPQVYYKGKLLGGNDIITEMYQSGDLKTLIGA
jgi:monothiol glutaredoxin